jgi:NTE family protein
MSEQPIIGLALSGGGARAMAFHLGCFRALHDRGILERVRVLSTVSGGSVIGASWAYRGETFAEFDANLTAVLRRGIQWDIAREVFLTPTGVRIAGTLVFTGSLSAVAAIAGFVVAWVRRWFGLPTVAIERALSRLTNALPIWGSLTTAFEDALARRLFGRATLDQVKRDGLTTVINACDLRTGTAFRFGSHGSGGWRYGRITGNPQTIAKAVAASAAFPILLPPLIERFDFLKKGERASHTVSLTDGGVFDNLGVSVLEPNRVHEASFTFPVTHLISLNAGPGQFRVASGHHYWWLGRVARSFEAVHRKVQDAVYQRLHKYAETGELGGFGMVYLGQQDEKLPWHPPDLVRREDVIDFPTDFAPMAQHDLDLLSKRGEQLTHTIMDRYLPSLGLPQRNEEVRANEAKKRLPAT